MTSAHKTPLALAVVAAALMMMASPGAYALSINTSDGSTLSPRDQDVLTRIMGHTPTPTEIRTYLDEYGRVPTDQEINAYFEARPAETSSPEKLVPTVLRPALPGQAREAPARLPTPSLFRPSSSGGSGSTEAESSPSRSNREMEGLAAKETTARGVQCGENLETTPTGRSTARACTRAWRSNTSVTSSTA